MKNLKQIYAPHHSSDKNTVLTALNVHHRVYDDNRKPRLINIKIVGFSKQLSIYRNFPVTWNLIYNYNINPRDKFGLHIFCNID